MKKTTLLTLCAAFFMAMLCMTACHNNNVSDINEIDWETANSVREILSFRNNEENTWNGHFCYCDGTIHGRFNATHDNPSLVVNNKLKKGEMLLSVKKDGKMIVSETKISQGKHIINNIPANKNDHLIVILKLSKSRGNFLIEMP